MKPFRFSLIFAILASLACLLGITWILLSLIFFKTGEKDLLAQKNEQGRVLAAAFVHLLPTAITDLPGSAAARFADRLAREPDFAGIAVFDGSGRPAWLLGDSGRTDASVSLALKKGGESAAFSADGRYLSRYAPFFAGRDLAGVCRLTFSLAGEHARMKRSRHLFLTYFLLDALLIICIGSFSLYRSVVIPTRKLLAATERIAAGDYLHPVHVPGSAEIAALGEAFNIMLGTLRAKDASVTSHVLSLERANSELKSAREESIRSEKMASVGLLAAGMAHEIGAPLSAIMGYAGILHDELQDDREKADYLRRIEGDCARIDRIVRDLLDYARPASAHNEMVDIALLVTSSVELLTGQGLLRQIEVAVTLEDDLPPVFADRQQLQQALVNLMINARDAMPGGGLLELRAARETGDGAAIWPRIRIDLSDSGTGISPDDGARIFEPFFTTKAQGKGTGLGLAIVARIIEGCGGRVSFESPAGEGTTFTILLPAVA